jgi:beta-glucosidase
MTKNLFILLVFCCLVSCQKQVTKNKIEQKVDSLLSVMTLEEKIGQLTLYTSGWDVTGPTLNENYLEYVRQGRCGNLFNAHTAEYTRKLQKIAVEETRLHIPLLFGYDVIHGYKTIFPIPLAEACSWDTALIEKTARLSAMEAASAGLHWTFNPMVDIARDPRWGRIAEGSGEDPYLGSLIARAKVRGYQGDDLADPFTLLACVKHFAAYGAAQAGRDYHTVDMSERVFREVYLPPYKAAIDAGVETVMTSFNEIDGVPASGSKKLFTDILRKEWGFEGFVVTDYTAINEMIPHGYSKDLKQASEQSINAGVDMDMQGGAYLEHLADLIKENKVTEKQINESVRRILIAKYKLGLFDDPYRYSDVDREKETVLSQELIAHSRESAKRSIVLLKNDPVKGNKLLPLKNLSRIAVIGPLGNNKIDMLGTWHASGDASKVITLVDALKEKYPKAIINYQEGCKTSGEDRSGIVLAVEAAKKADVVVMAIGEDFQQSGEAASRSELGLPGLQQELLERIYATGKPVVVVLMAGRPLTIPWMSENIPAIVNAWHLGTQAGNAIVDVLSGDYNPSGKLVITFPRNVGQIPIYYSMKNTGRPFNADDKYTSKYIDVANEPLYPFGYGLSYSTFTYGDVKLSEAVITTKDKLTVRCTVTNSGSVDGEEVVQLYIRDVVGSVTRPVKELKGFQKIFLKAGESKEVSFILSENDLSFYKQDMRFGSEPGEFIVFVGGNSRDVKETRFELR